MKADRRDLLRAILLLGALALVSLWPLPIHPDRMVMPAQGEFSDLAISHWPMQGWMREAVLEYGEWPFWHPAYFSGQTLAGNPLSGFYYPPNWLHFLLPSVAAFAVLILLHVWLAGVGMFALMRYGAGASFGGALASAILFAFGQRLGAHLSAGHVSLLYGWAWVPWVLLGTLRASTFKGGWRAGLLLGVAFLADVRVGYYAGLAVGVVFLGRGVAALARRGEAFANSNPLLRERISRHNRTCHSEERSDEESRSPQAERGAMREILRLRLRMTLGKRGRSVSDRCFAPAAAAVLAFAGTAAVLILPLLELLGQTTRVGLSPQEAAAFSLPPGALMGALLPLRPATHEWTVYLGIPACALLILSAWSSRRRLVWALWIGAMVAVILALGTHTPLYGPLLAILPGLKFLRVPARFWVLALACLSALAGLGMDALFAMEQEAGQKARLAVIALLAVVAVLCGAAALMGVRDAGVYLQIGFFGAGALIVSALALWGKIPVKAAIIIVLAFLFADQIMSARGWWRLASVEEVTAPGREVAAYLAALPDGGRVYSPSYSLPQQTAWRFGLEMADGVDPTQIRRYGQFMAAAGGYGDAGYSVTIPPFPPDEPLATAFADSEPNAALLGLLNVRYLVSEFPISGENWKQVTQIDSTHVYENARALPRAWLVHDLTVVRGSEDVILGAVASSDPAREVILEEPLPGPVGAPESAAAETVRIVKRTPNTLEIEVQAGAPGVLVLSEVWYPGWRASMGGERVPVLRADYVLRGVYIARAGTHIVRMEYVPVLVYVGAALSAATVLAFVIMAFVGGRR